MPNVALNNVTTANAFTAANTMDAPAFYDHVNLDVSNAAIYWQIKQVGRPGEDARMAVWQAEVFMTPASRTIRRAGLTGIRVRSAVAGTPAQVTIEMVG